MSGFLKELVSNIPYPIGRLLTKVPFRYRLGSSYTDFQRLINSSITWSEDQKINYTVLLLNAIKNHAEHKFPFYKALYESSGVSGLTIKDLSDWEKIPLTTKELFRAELSNFNGSQKINTGGTSGHPFAFYIDKNAWAREWAHMHYIWSLRKYNYTLPKITLRGKNLGSKIIHFNPIHNEFIINTYIDFSRKENALKVKEVIYKHDIKFIHGYPSAIYNFLKELERTLGSNDLDLLKNTLKTCLLGSEYPQPHITNYLEKKWGLNYISWYGHSEMCILGYDSNNNNTYSPFLTYGYAEIINNELIGTSFHNYDMPLIRYRTGDIVEGNSRDGILESFSIKEGRSGDFIEDNKGKLIPLTALIFGRHHKAFEIFDFIQVHQESPGNATILVTNKAGGNIPGINSLFDLTNLDINFNFEILDKPILSKSGKFKLKI